MAWSWLQSASGSNNGSSTLGVTFTTANLTSGSTLIALVANFTNNGTISQTSVKDGAGNSFVQVATVTAAGSAGQQTAIWALNTPAGDVGSKPTITATVSAGTPVSIGMLVQEVSGIITSSTAAGFRDGTAGTLTGTATGSIGPPTYASTAANEYLVYAYGDNGAGGTWTAPGGIYTSDPNGINTSANDSVEIAYGNSTNGTETGQYSLSGGSGNSWSLILVAFKLLSSGLPAPLSNHGGPSQAKLPARQADYAGGSQGNIGLVYSSLVPGMPDNSYSTGRISASFGGPVKNPSRGPAPDRGPLPNFPVFIVTGAGWKNAGHSK